MNLSSFKKCLFILEKSANKSCVLEYVFNWISISDIYPTVFLSQKEISRKFTKLLKLNFI